MKAYLIVAAGSQKGRKLRLFPSPFVIGRDPGCQLRPVSRRVSKQHCKLVIGEGRVGIIDLDSTNGTYVNGDRILAPVVLKNGDRIDIGPLSFKVAFTSIPIPSADPVAASALAVAAAQWLEEESSVHEIPVSAGDEPTADDLPTLTNRDTVPEVPTFTPIPTPKPAAVRLDPHPSERPIQ